MTIPLSNYAPAKRSRSKWSTTDILFLSQLFILKLLASVEGIVAKKGRIRNQVTIAAVDIADEITVDVWARLKIYRKRKDFRHISISCSLNIYLFKLFVQFSRSKDMMLFIAHMYELAPASARAHTRSHTHIHTHTHKHTQYTICRVWTNLAKSSINKRTIIFFL